MQKLKYFTKLVNTCKNPHFISLIEAGVCRAAKLYSHSGAFLICKSIFLLRSSLSTLDFPIVLHICQSNECCQKSFLYWQRETPPTVNHDH